MLIRSSNLLSEILFFSNDSPTYLAHSLSSARVEKI